MTAVVCEALAVSGFIVVDRNVVTREASSKYCVIRRGQLSGGGTLADRVFTPAGRHRYYTALRIAYVIVAGRR